MSGEPVYFARCGRRKMVTGGYSTSANLMVFDLGAVLPKDLPPLDGVLGLDAFAGQTVTVDIARSELIVESPQSLARRVRGLPRGVMRLRHEGGGIGLTTFLRARAEGGVLWLLADSANLDDVRLSSGVRDRLGPGVDPKEPFTFDLRLDGLAPAPVRARVTELIHDGALNQAFFAGRPITFDLARGRVWYGPPR